MTPIVEMRRISKAFGAVRALADVDLVLHPGEILGLVGDNSAGKSTLMKILTGASIVLPQHWVNAFIGVILIVAVLIDIWIRQANILGRLRIALSRRRRTSWEAAHS